MWRCVQPRAVAAVLLVSLALSLRHAEDDRGQRAVFVGAAVDDDEGEGEFVFNPLGGGGEDGKIFNQFQKGATDFFAVPDYDEKNDEAKRAGKEYACGICHALVNMVELFFTEEGKVVLKHLSEGHEDRQVKYKSFLEQAQAAGKKLCENMKESNQVMRMESLRVCTNVVDLEMENMIDDKSTGTSLDDFCQDTAMLCRKGLTRDHLNKASNVWGETLRDMDRQSSESEKNRVFKPDEDIAFDEDDEDYAEEEEL